MSKAVKMSERAMRSKTRALCGNEERKLSPGSPAVAEGMNDLEVNLGGIERVSLKGNPLQPMRGDTQTTGGYSESSTMAGTIQPSKKRPEQATQRKSIFRNPPQQISIPSTSPKKNIKVTSPVKVFEQAKKTEVSRTPSKTLSNAKKRKLDGKQYSYDLIAVDLSKSDEVIGPLLLE